MALGKIDLEQGADDDDVFLALHRIQSDKHTVPRNSAAKKVVKF